MKPNKKIIYVHDEKSGRPKRQEVSSADTPDQTLFTVGTNGDFATLNEAFSYLDNFGSYLNQTEIRMLDGYYIEEKLTFAGKDYRNIVLTSEGDENVISREFFLQNEETEDFIDASQTFLPLIGARLRMDESGTPFNGNNNLGNNNNIFNLRGGSRLEFLSSSSPIMDGSIAGIDGAMARNIIAHNSSILLDYQSYVRNGGNNHGVDYTFTGGGLSWLRNIHVFFSSTLTISGAVVSGGFNTSIDVSGGSSSYIQQAGVNGAGTHSLEVENSRVAIRYSDLRLDDATEVAADINIAKGGIVQMADSSGGSNLTPNTITSDGLLIK